MNRSRKLVVSGLAFLVLATLALPGSLRAQGGFVYTNDEIIGENTVSAFSVAPYGGLTLLPGSPYLTGGMGSGACYYASNRITVSAVGDFLFVSNTGSNDVSAFNINTKTGALKLVAGSPFPTGGTDDACGIALSATPDGKFLMAANSGSNNITVFRISGSGVLTPITGSPFPALSTPDGIMVNPNGQSLAVAEIGTNAIEMFSIASNGSLTSKGAFPASSGGPGAGVAGVDIDCYPNVLYGGMATDGTTIVDGWSISTTGTLTPLPLSPFEPGVGTNSNVVVLDYGWNEKFLFVSNQYSNTITEFYVTRLGNLVLVPGSPFAMRLSPEQFPEPSGMATSENGQLLFVANLTNTVSVFNVDINGGLTEVKGSPFPTGQTGGLESVTAFPPRMLPIQQANQGGCRNPSLPGF